MYISYLNVTLIYEFCSELYMFRSGQILFDVYSRLLKDFIGCNSEIPEMFIQKFRSVRLTIMKVGVFDN